MRHKAIKAIATAVIGFSLLSVAAAVGVPVLRHAVVGWWNSPDWLAALPENPRVHYEPGAAEQARAVAAALPDAIAKVESAQGRMFARPVTIGVYVSTDAFVAANGLGNPSVVGTTFLGHVMLSPVLFSTQRRRMSAILTHELSHAHLQTWISQWAWWHLPNWFKEGLAVMVSGGGGAEGISEAQAREAIRRGDHIAVESSGSFLDLSDIQFENPPVIPDSSFRTRMAYRQAGMFVSFLHDTDPTGFKRLMDAIYDGRPFADAVTAGYATGLPRLWDRFVERMVN